MPRSRVFVGDLTRPAPLIATTILAVNDHVMKGSGVLPGAVTGKLSDLAGLFVAPIVLVCVARIVGSARGTTPARDGRLAVFAIASVAIVFALLKTCSPFNAAVNRVWGPHVLDASDLWCLPSALLAWVWLRDREVRARGTASRVTASLETGYEPGPPRFASALVFVGTLLVCAATPKAPPVPPPSVPMWSIAAKPLELGCGTAAVWVSKSGKTGVGVTVRVTPRTDQPCVTTVAASLRFADRAFAGTLVVSKPASELVVLETSGRDRDDREHANATYHYLAFELDNQARWNRGDRTATFELAINLATGSAPATPPGSGTPVAIDPVAPGSTPPGTTGSVATGSTTPGPVATGSTTPVATGSAAPPAPPIAPEVGTPGANTTRLTWSLPATHAYAEFPVGTR
jgi:hypothetical protein